MTWNTMGRGALAMLVSLATGLGLTACSSDYTVGYIYAPAAKNSAGVIDGYKVDYQLGYLTQLEDSPVPSGGKNPVAIVASPNHKFLYVVHRDDSNVAEFAIGTDGKIYAQNTYNVTGSFPVAAAIDAGGKFLYVVFTYQNCPAQGVPTCQAGGQLYTPANPGPGGVTIFPIKSDNSLGTPLTYNLGRNPVAVMTSSKNNFVYVIAQDSATTANLFGFSADTSTGQLTALPGITINPGNVVSTGYPSGVTPAGIIGDSSASHLYITDKASNQVMGYTIAANGVPSAIPGGVAKTDASPAGMSFDTTGQYLYVASYTGGSVNGYTLGSNGQPIVSTTTASTQAGSGPTCVTVIGAPSSASPTHAVYMYTSNSLSNDVSAMQLNPKDGSLIQVQNTPFVASALPSCLVSVPSIPR